MLRIAYMCLAALLGALAPAAAQAPPGAATGGSPRAGDSVAERVAAALEARVPGWLTETGEPGLAVALVEDGAVAAIRTWGVADRATGRPIEPGTLFNVGSISKTLTAWGVMRLAEIDEIDLDAPVGRYLERWSIQASGFDPDGVTVRRLLSHTAGVNVPSVAGVDPGEPAPSLLDELRVGRPEEGIEPVRLVAEPGSVFAYSGGGYLILQLLIEDVTGRDFAAWMEDEVLRPLGMEDSGFGIGPERPDVAAVPYAVDGTPYALRVFPGLAAAGLWSTPADMAAFLVAHGPAGAPGRGVVSPRGLASMREPVPPAERYGLGYEVYPPVGDQPVVAHSGSNLGWKADFILFPKAGLGIVAMSNVDEGKTRKAALEAFRDAVLEAAEGGFGR